VNELDELFTFVESKKYDAYVATQVDRASRCIVGWIAVPERTPEDLQAMLDRSPQADQYYSDAYTLYQALLYTPGRHTAVSDKRQTYSVEADSAELRHYLARLARRSRCFSRLFTPYAAPSSCLSTPGTGAKSTSAASRPIPPISAISYILEFIHSPLPSPQCVYTCHTTRRSG
jgi:IS1 family transposase